ncbi:hypothetical protein IMCC9480_1237 [Oxalobacteraceae bacterium IMCC9480]|nr:hypothetical protein IMCC9480_1237 [Oxalobacteraceae bacterium IMCC9480]
MPLERREDHVAGLERVRIQRHRQLDLHHADRIGVGHVADDLRDELGVGHDDGRPVNHLDLGGPHVDPADVAFDAGQGHPVTHFHGTLGQQDQAGDKVLDHALQAEADTDRQGAGHPCHALQADPDCRHRQGDDQDHAQIAGQRRQRHAHAVIEPRRRHQAAAYPALEHTHQKQADAQHEQSLEHRRWPDADLADRQPFVDVAGPVQQFERALAKRRHQQHQREQRDQNATGAGQQDRSQLQCPRRRWDGLAWRCRLQRFGWLDLGREQSHEQVVGDDGQQVGGTRHNKNPAQLVEQKAGHRDVAGDKSEQGQQQDQQSERAQRLQPQGNRKDHRVGVDGCGGITFLWRCAIKRRAPELHQRRHDQQGMRQGSQAFEDHCRGEAQFGGHREPGRDAFDYHRDGKRQRKPAQPPGSPVGNRQ